MFGNNVETCAECTRARLPCTSADVCFVFRQHASVWEASYMTIMPTYTTITPTYASITPAYTTIRPTARPTIQDLASEVGSHICIYDCKVKPSARVLCTARLCYHTDTLLSPYVSNCTPDESFFGVGCRKGRQGGVAGWGSRAHAALWPAGNSPAAGPSAGDPLLLPCPVLLQGLPQSAPAPHAPIRV